MPGEAEPLSHDMIILYVTVMLVRTLIIVYFCPCVSVQGLFTGRVGTSNQLGIAGFGAGCILGECLHGNASQFCVCVRVFFFSALTILLLHIPVLITYGTGCVARTKII